MNINQYAVYQLKESAELAAYRSRSYQYLTEHHFQVIVQNYQQAYFTKLFTSDTPEMIRKRLEEHRPKNFRGRPFGVGDVIVINQQGEITAYFVDKDSLVVVAGFIRSSSSGILVTLDTKNLFIDQRKTTMIGHSTGRRITMKPLFPEKFLMQPIICGHPAIIQRKTDPCPC